MLAGRARDRASSYEPVSRYPRGPREIGQRSQEARRGDGCRLSEGKPVALAQVHVPLGPRLRREQETRTVGLSQRVSRSALSPTTTTLRACTLAPPSCRSLICADSYAPGLWQRKALSQHMPARCQRSGKDDPSCCKVVSTSEVVGARV